MAVMSGLDITKKECGGDMRATAAAVYAMYLDKIQALDRAQDVNDSKVMRLQRRIDQLLNERKIMVRKIDAYEAEYGEPE